MSILPKECQRFDTDGARIFPHYLKPTPANLSMAESIIDVYRYSVEDIYETLDTQLNQMCQENQRFRTIKGMRHLLEKRLGFRERGSIDPTTLRLELFRRAAKVSSANFPNRQWREDIMRAVSSQFEVRSEELETLMYADLKDQWVIESFECISPEELLSEYNLAQAQSLLLYAKSLQFSLTISPRDGNSLRRLFRHLRFFNLLFDVKQVADTTWQFKVDGPAAVLPQPQKYGIALASFLRTLFLFKNWAATAEIKDSNDKFKHWELRPNDFEAPHRVVAERIPEEAERLIQRLRETAPELDITDSPSILTFSPQAVWIPDFSATIRASGAIAHVEILGYWRADYLNRRLKALSKAPKNLILVLSEKMKVDKAALAETKIPIVTYKTTPLPKAVLKAILLHAK